MKTTLRSTFRSMHLTAALVLSLVTAMFAAPLLAATVTGEVTNGTTHKPSAGDTVVLIDLQEKMQEVAKTKTDSRGRFSLTAPDSNMHLIRVEHEQATYFQPVPPSTSSVKVEVFDVAEQVPGVTTEANVMRIETNPQGLQITQSIFVKNDSHPPRTQFGKHSYEIYLPPGAKIQGSAAMGPGGMPVRSSPMPLGNNLYTYLFAIRPGETQFQITYSLPYSGSFSFSPRMASDVANFVVMLPKSMTLKPGDGVSFQTVNEDPSVQTFLIRNVSTSQALNFSVSGSGAMPRDSESASSQGSAASGPGGGGEGAAGADNRPGGGLGVPIDTPDPLNKYKWWILGGIFLALAVAAALLLRKPPQLAPAPASSEPVPPNTQIPGSKTGLLAALKDELFAIETDRVQGKLTGQEYEQLKAALELVLRRALNRKAN